MDKILFGTYPVVSVTWPAAEDGPKLSMVCFRPGATTVANATNGASKLGRIKADDFIGSNAGGSRVSGMSTFLSGFSVSGGLTLE